MAITIVVPVVVAFFVLLFILVEWLLLGPLGTDAAGVCSCLQRWGVDLPLVAKTCWTWTWRWQCDMQVLNSGTVQVPLKSVQSLTPVVLWLALAVREVLCKFWTSWSYIDLGCCWASSTLIPKSLRSGVLYHVFSNVSKYVVVACGLG